jgi:uncharacterized protein (TIGR00290 family)
MTDRKLLVSWSTGKDSAWMVHTLRAQGDGVIGGLLTSINERAHRVSMHGVRVELLEAQAEALGLALWPVPLPDPCSNDEYARRFSDVVRRAVAEGFTHVAFGDLFLEDVRAYREERLRGTGLAPLFPLWGQPTDDLAREMVREGLEACITCVDPAQLDRAFIGRSFDRRLLAELPSGVDPCGERGEFHTFAHAGPMFSRPIAVRTGSIVERGGFVFADVLPLAPRASPDATSPLPGGATVQHVRETAVQPGLARGVVVANLD